MQLAMRALIVLSLPVLAFGWLVSALPEPPPVPLESTLIFAVGGIVLVLGGSMVLTGWEFVRTFRVGSPAPLPTPRPLAVVGLLAAIGTLSMLDRSYDGDAVLIGWLQVVGVTAVFFGLQMTAVVVARSLVGMWARPELAIWPGRRTVIGVLLAASLAATPVSVGQPNFDFGFGVDGPPYLVPLAELVRVDAFGDPQYPSFVYTRAYDYND